MIVSRLLRHPTLFDDLSGSRHPPPPTPTPLAVVGGDDWYFGVTPSGSGVLGAGVFGPTVVVPSTGAVVRFGGLSLPNTPTLPATGATVGNWVTAVFGSPATSLTFEGGVVALDLVCPPRTDDSIGGECRLCTPGTASMTAREPSGGLCD